MSSFTEGASRCACGAAGSEPRLSTATAHPWDTLRSWPRFPATDTARAGGLCWPVQRPVRGRSSGEWMGSPGVAARLCLSFPSVSGGVRPCSGMLGGTGGGGRSRWPGTRSGCSAGGRRSPPCPRLPALARAAGLFPRPSGRASGGLVYPSLGLPGRKSLEGLSPEALRPVKTASSWGSPGRALGAGQGAGRTEWVELGALGPTWLDCGLSCSSGVVVCVPL